ncbi:nucleoside monophosphate kinase [Candidatus Pacebacteria bacterium]|nr:nucleoside monophosphate kinase [Candidatus Paceibacterota bacterium]
MQPQTILFIGPQGSGKGTQVRNLIARLKEIDPSDQVMDVETGKLFRVLSETDNATARRVKGLIENGKPVPDFVTNSFVMQDFRERFSKETHITLDGFPRNVEQSVFLDQILDFYGRKELSVVYLDTPEEVVRGRMVSRGRVDDTQEGITERLRWSMEMMQSMLEYYKKRPHTKFVIVDGAQSVTDVQKEIQKALNI